MEREISEHVFVLLPIIGNYIPITVTFGSVKTGFYFTCNKNLININECTICRIDDVDNDINSYWEQVLLCKSEY